MSRKWPKEKSKRTPLQLAGMKKGSRKRAFLAGMPQPQGGGGRSGVSGFARGRLGLGEFVAEQVTEGNAAAVGVAGDVDGVVHRGDVAHDVAEHVEALDDLAVLIQAQSVSSHMKRSPLSFTKRNGPWSQQKA